MQETHRKSVLLLEGHTEIKLEGYYLRIYVLSPIVIFANGTFTNGECPQVLCQLANC